MDERSRRHFQAIAEAFEADGQKRLDEAMQLTALQRMTIGYELGQFLSKPETEAERIARARQKARLHWLKRMPRTSEQ